MRLFLLIGLLAVIASPAAAQSLYSCGPVDSYNVDKSDSDTHDMCDIYARQLEYRKERLRLKDQLEARQQNYAIARRAALQNYEQELAELHASYDPPQMDETPAASDDVDSPISLLTNALTNNAQSPFAKAHDKVDPKKNK